MAKLIAWAFGVASVVAHSPVAMADTPCRPGVNVSGGEDLVREVASELVAHGIDVNPPATCPRVRVQLAREEEQIVVDLTDPAARTIRRRVSRVGEAVTVIESWARPDMNADLLAGFDVPTAVLAPPPVVAPNEPTAARPSPGGPASEVATRASIGPRRGQRSPMTVSLVGDLGFDQRASWIGTMVTACTPLWRTCIGGTGHLRTPTAGGLSADAAVVATIELPFRVRRFTLIPGLGVGVGRDSSGMADGMQNQPAPSWSPRAEARIVASYPLARWVFVDVVVGVVAASASSDQQNQTGDNSSATGLAPLLELGAGLRVGAP